MMLAYLSRIRKGADPGVKCTPARSAESAGFLIALAMAYSRSSSRAITVSECIAAEPAALVMDISVGAGGMPSRCARYVAPAAAEKQASRLRAQRFARRAGDKLCCPGFMALALLFW